jgi:glycosyltransferase involved in cell wall biosynthesis
MADIFGKSSSAIAHSRVQIGNWAVRAFLFIIDQSASRMKPIRLLVDSFADADEFNAQMTNARDLVSRLDPERFHVTMFLCGEPHGSLAGRPATRFIRLGKRLQTLRILREFIFGHQSILFYVKASPASKLYLRLRRTWRDRRVVIGSVESQSDFRKDETIKDQQIRLLEETVLRSDVLFSNSSSVRASLQKYYGRESEVIPTGIDTKLFTPDWNRPPNPRPRVLFVGSLRRFKGPQLLVNAASRFTHADFVIIGNGPLESELRAEIQRRQLSNCELAGGRYGPDLLEQYRRADVFLFPSHWEGSPKVILEAAACGLPVLARSDYEPETVEHGKTGYLAGNERELLEHLDSLLASADLRRNLGRASRTLSERFDWDLITRQWERVFSREASKLGVQS